ncbi:hypothetical protein LPB303_15975 [Polaribacter atrinae]|uniref:Uncharacterized protein n=1 Tax=Polaribacter atrinae TaxID=1333662 RepID=A0A176SYT0_9FLAO|nr:hypothetical protein [Polaribacter atrinae]OAD40749.1 hypothetical protein LPB303_15975 [Polaribacter atrinae]
MRKIKTVFNILSIIFGIILIFWFTQINYSDISFKENSSAYLGILSMAMISIALQMIIRGIKLK